MGETNVCVAGVGMIPFAKPGRSDPYDVMGAAATRAALEDAGLSYDQVGAAYVGFLYGDTTSGQRALYRVGMTGVPIVNVNNACATGSTALYLARNAVRSGQVECALALGFEQMAPGALEYVFNDRPGPLGDFTALVEDTYEDAAPAPLAVKLFGAAAREYAAETGMKPESFAKVSVKARRHAANNPFAIFNQPITVEEVLASAPMFEPLTRLQCCPPTCGAAAAVVCSEDFARRHGLSNAVRILGQGVHTDYRSTFDERSMAKVIGFDMAKTAAEDAYAEAGLGPEDVDLVELHDCFTSNEILAYEALGFAPRGGAERMIEDGDNTYGGQVVTNPSGGLLSKGHPIGATGLAQCAELTWHLRGAAGARQVENARIGLQHNLGLGGVCVVTVYGAA